MCIVNWLLAYLQIVMLLILFVTAIATWLSAGAAKKAAKETQKATTASLIASLVDDYSSTEMLDSMLELSSFSNQHGDNFGDEFRSLRISNYNSIRIVDRSRRRVSHFFHKIHILQKLGYLDQNSVKEVATREQIQFFRQVVEPLEAALNPNYDRSAFESLGGLYNIEPGSLPMANPQHN